MIKRILGIDLGIASIGYALVEFDDHNLDEENKKTGKIIKAGVRVFEAAEHPKDGSSLALIRREKRLARRLTRRKSRRLNKIKNIFIDHNLITKTGLENLYNTSPEKLDPWELRKQGLERILTGEELARVLTHIAKRRGYKSTRIAAEKADKEQGKMLTAIKNTREKLITGNFETVGQMYATIYRDNEPKRNKKDIYNNSIPRDLLEEEVKIIFQKQQELGSKLATKNLEEEYIKIAFFQMDSGSVEHMIGDCTFEKGQKRAAKESYSAELFVAHTKCLNTTLIDHSVIKGERTFTPEEITLIINKLKSTIKVSYKTIRKELKLSDSIKFKGLKYDQEELVKASKKATDAESEEFFTMKGYHKLRKQIEDSCSKERWKSISDNHVVLDTIAYAITAKKSDEEIRNYLIEHDIDKELIEAVIELSMKKVIHLSTKAIEKILPYMQKGLKYHEACIEAGYNHSRPDEKGDKSRLLALPKDLPLNPVATRAITQFRKVVNAIIKQHGSFHQMNIELARDLSLSHGDRKKVKDAQQENRDRKKEAVECFLKDNPSIDPNNIKNVNRFILWKQQGEMCVYSQEHIYFDQLFDPELVEIDHIIPYSKSFDDSLNNKVVCYISENQHKKNKIPYEYFRDHKPEKWDDFIGYVKSLNIKSAKKNRLLKLSYDGEGFKERNLNDTRYISRFIKNYVETGLYFEPYQGIKQKVRTRSGSLTGFLRTQWGLIKNREESQKHHALDAIVIACATDGMVKYLSTVSAKIEGYEWIKHQKPRFKAPWDNFKNEVNETLNNIFVSRMPKRKITGQAHKDTIKSDKLLNEGKYVLKTAIEKITLANIEKIYDKESNKNLYMAIKTRLEKAKEDPKEAISVDNPVYMPLSEEKIKQGIKPHIIKSIKLEDTQKSGIKINKGISNNGKVNIGIADNGDMIRIDVFSKKDKKNKMQYYAIPLYVADFVNGELPMKVVAGGKDGWKSINETYQFKYSLYANDLISINETGKNDDERLFYYNSFDIDSSRIIVESIDRSVLTDTNMKNKPWQKRYSILNLPAIKKYYVDVLGNYYEAKNEKRQGVKAKKNELENSISKQPV